MTISSTVRTARATVLVGVLACSALVLALGGGCGGAASPSPAGSSPTCRQWMRHVVSSTGTAYDCTAGGTTAQCSAFPLSLSTTWTYSSLEDFVREAAVPNRPLVLREETVGCGTFAYLGCNHVITEYTHDTQGRLLRRERSAWHDLGGEQTFDVTTYSAWDGRGRATVGEVTAGGRAESVTLTYDDARRLVEVSSGELVEQDRHGNTIRRVTKYGVGPGERIEEQFRIESLQPVCEP